MERPKRYNVVDVLDMWEDIPDDNCDVTDESSDEDIDLSDTDYIPVGDEIEAREPEETTTEINTPDTTKPKEKLPTKRQRISSNDKDNERTVQEKKRQKRNTNEKNNEQWHRIFFGIVDRTIVNAMIVYSKLEGQSMSVLDYKRAVAQALITRATPVKVGRPRSTPSPLGPTKRRKSGPSVSKEIRLQNRGVHWVTYDKKRGRCEVCQVNNVELRPHSKCSFCKVFLCCNEKNCFAVFHEIEE